MLIQAPKTAAYLANKPLNADTLTGAIAILDGEVTPGPDPTTPTKWVVFPPAYRRSLGTGLFYKFFLAEGYRFSGLSKPSVRSWL